MLTEPSAIEAKRGTPARITLRTEHPTRYPRPDLDPEVFTLAAGAAMDDAVEHGYKAVRFVSVTESIERDELDWSLVFVYSWEFTAHKSQEQQTVDGAQALADALDAHLGR